MGGDLIAGDTDEELWRVGWSLARNVMRQGCRRSDEMWALLFASGLSSRASTNRLCASSGGTGDTAPFLTAPKRG